MKPSPELVTNGGFDTDADWTKQGTTPGWSIAGGVASADNDTNADLVQDIGAIPGNTYRVTYTILNYVKGNVAAIIGGTGGGQTPANGTYIKDIIAGSFNSNFLIRGGSDHQFDVDNVSVKEIKTIAKPSAELITNNGFDTDTDWTKSGGWSISDGVASCDGTAGDLRQFPTLTPGNTYRLTYEITAITAGRIRLRVGGTNNASDNSTLGFKTEDFVAGSTANRIDIRPIDGFNGSIDNVFLKEVKAIIK